MECESDVSDNRTCSLFCDVGYAFSVLLPDVISCSFETGFYWSFYSIYNPDLMLPDCVGTTSIHIV